MNTNEKMLMFRNRLTRVYRHIGKLAKKQGISCYRIYDHDIPEFPFCIEIYGPNIYVAEYARRHGMSEEAHDGWLALSLDVVADVLQTDREHIFLKLRQRKPGRLGQYQKYGEVQHEFIIKENGLNFIVNLSDYLDTGLFLDHRLTRDMVRKESAGKKVLNLFAYTGSFSVYAAAGGAAEVVTVDLSNTYLQWAERNFRANDLPTDDSEAISLKFVQADVLQYLVSLPRGYFDLVIMDPPTFSNSKRMDEFLDIQRDHVRLINQCLDAMSNQGVLYFSTNLRTFKLDESSINSTKIKDITRATTSFDFEGRLYRQCFRIINDSR